MRLYCKTCNGVVMVEPDMQYRNVYEYTCINCGRSKYRKWNHDELTRKLNKEYLDKTFTMFFWYDRPHVGRRTLLATRGGEWSIVGEKDISDGRRAVEN